MMKVSEKGASSKKVINLQLPLQDANIHVSFTGHFVRNIVYCF